MRDRHGRDLVYLRVAVTDRCNLRCTYCMPSGPAFHDRGWGLSSEELVRLVSLFVRLGIRKVRLTGGEPTVRKGIVDLCQALSTLPGLDTLALTTNGTQLEALAQPLFKAGVKRLNVSLDSVRRERFAGITGQDALPAVLSGIRAAVDAGFAPLKLNTVVMNGVNDDELLDFVALAREQPLEIRFIEFMPFKGNGWRGDRFLPSTTMQRRIGAVYPLVPDGRLERTGGVARDFSIPGFLGRVSFITPFSDSFCQRCNRLRLTSDGRLKTCLYAPAEVDLRGALRRGEPDAALEAMIAEAIDRKPESHPPLDAVAEQTDTIMNEVGG